jgi:hypothetical protein
MTGLAYPAARTVARLVHEHFIRQLASSHRRGSEYLPPRPDEQAIEKIIDAAFWASLRREEGYSPKISLAFLRPEESEHPLMLERKLPLNPAALSRLAPAVERPGIHLGVSPEDGQLLVWGTTRTIPRFCLVLEVIEPGVLVVKYRRHESGKFVNVVVLKGDQIKEVDEDSSDSQDWPAIIRSLLGFGSFTSADDNVSVFVQMAVSMRAHRRGGTLLVAPHHSESWLESIVRPITYSVSPVYSELARLMRQDESARKTHQWQESFLDAIDALAGLTAVDGATVISDQYELLAFGAKIGLRPGVARVDQMIITEPVVGATASIVQPLEFGGTRHLSAAQFAQDQHDSIALVASQDGHFTVFAWSPGENMVHAHRVETLLL